MAPTLKQSLKENLTSNRWVLNDLCKEAKISQTLLSLILSGKRNPRYENAVRLAEAANKLTGLDDFYKWQDFREDSK